MFRTKMKVGLASGMFALGTGAAMADEAPM